MSPLSTPNEMASSHASTPPVDGENEAPATKRLAANAGVGFVAKSQTKNALLREAQTKEQLRKEFVVMQEAVRATELLLPFVFYDGAGMAGGGVA